MPLDLDVVGRTSEMFEHSWTATDSLLYAVGVGAGQDDPLEELAFTTENTAGVEQRVLPTFALILAQFRGPRIPLGDFDGAQLVHAEQTLTLRQALPAAGSIRVQSRIANVWDKGSGALVVTETSGWLIDDPDDAPTVTAQSSVFIRGEGGFGIKQASTAWEESVGEPDLVLRFTTRPDQALLYRLSGDRNPLHSDPAFAARGGFERPILHGLCTYGNTARVLLNALTAGDPNRFVGMEGRFSRPVTPGDAFSVKTWVSGTESKFSVLDGHGDAVITRGRFLTR
jgi:acyl dehydratase